MERFYQDELMVFSQKYVISVKRAVVCWGYVYEVRLVRTIHLQDAFFIDVQFFVHSKYRQVGTTQ